VIPEKPLAACGSRKFQLDDLGDHLCTCTTHSGVKKDHDWAGYQLPDLFRTTHKVKTQQVVKSHGHHCGDIELAGYLANASGLVTLVLDLRIAHDRFGSSSDPSLNGHLHHPNDMDRSLNEAVADKIRKYRADYNNVMVYHGILLRYRVRYRCLGSGEYLEMFPKRKREIDETPNTMNE
jgi:hypothetical protein